ncbi:MAG TPA: FecR domain-containing protein [Rhizomicrobium sp.]|nr:FecR domain-containing protein [Rhizomicrobium sp.]
MTDASDIEYKAADWLQRRQFWNWSDEDQKALDAWLAESSAHRVAFLRLKAGYAQTERLVALRNSKPDRGTRNGRRWFHAVAALAAIGVIGAGATFYVAKPESVTYATPVGGRQTLTLADGTRIELNTDTTLKLNKVSGKRSVTLVKGEAYFQVQHDAARPFVVETAGHTVTDLGTKFTVHTEQNRIEVRLVEGEARLDAVDTAKPQPSMLLKPGDVAVATADTMSVKRETLSKLADDLGWRRGLIVFHDTTLADAAERLNRYNTNKLVIDRAAARLKINGTFRADDAQTFAQMARDVFGLRITTTSDNTRLSR